MKIPTFSEVERIIDTLPIGLYAGRRVAISLNETQKASSYSPAEDCIVISYPQTIVGVDKASTENEVNMLIRSNFYHEVSHAILTPTKLAPNYAVNVVEDERIERNLKTFYYNVDFEKSVYLMNGFTEGAPLPTPTTADEAFYLLVRFHKGAPKWKERVDKLLEEYSYLYRDSDKFEVEDYRGFIQCLYNEFCDEWKKPCETAGATDPLEYSMDIVSNGESADENESISTDIKGDSTDIKESSADTEEGADDTNAKMREVFNKVVNGGFDTALHKGIEILLSNYHKKNSKGGAVSAYSGVLNTRNAGALDYRIFDRSLSRYGTNQFGSIHLNLFIDVSGSFSYNDNAVNRLLKSLIYFESQFHNFTFDVITMGPDEVVLSKNRRHIRSSGGNHLSKKIFDIFRSQQKPQTYNYNIVMFDGDAYSNDVSRRDIGKNWIDETGKGFLAFAHNNCTIISDPYNRGYISRYCPSTRTVYTTNFVKEFEKNILDIMQIALN